ncbi:MAG: OmpA family protein [Chitinophagales bacterium]
MRKILFIASIFAFAFASAQNSLPPNPEPGKCYVKCITPDVYETVSEEVLIAPAYKKLKVVPAEYKTVEERVEVKPATKKFIYHAAEFETYTETYKSKEGYSKLTVVPATFDDASHSYVVEPATARWEYADAYADCKSDDPRDCQVLCWKEYDEIEASIPTQVIDKDASTTSKTIDGETSKIKKQRIVKDAYVEEIAIPAEYKTITKTVLVKNETTVEENVPAVYETITREVLKTQGGVEVWEEIECELTQSNILPIYYELGSARLTADSKKIIDEKLYTLMTSKPNIKIALSSHTDSRGSASSNLDLSERRAQAVVTYLISKGINSSRLVANGYGETQLKNRCADGVSCTEKEHQQNRRTEFRVLSY